MSELHATESADASGAGGNCAVTADLSVLVGLPERPKIKHRPRPSRIEIPEEALSRTSTAGRTSRGRKISKACDRCRLKKVKCRGEDPCDRCQSDKAICVRKEKRARPKSRKVSPASADYAGPSTPRFAATRRSTSPYPYNDNAWSRSQSPCPSLHSDSECFFETKSLPEAGVEEAPSSQPSDSAAWADSAILEVEAHSEEYIELETATENRVARIAPYQYSPVSASSIRLLRLSPGCSSDPLICALKPLPIDKVKTSLLSFQALSYAWGQGFAEKSIVLFDIPESGGNEMGLVKQDNPPETELYRSFFVRENLYHAMLRLRQPDQHTWLWVDAICINQEDEHDKSQQIPNMPEIYSAAWNVVVWLGERNGSEEDTQLAVDLLPRILNLRTLDAILDIGSTADHIIRTWLAFGRLLRSPWFSRRWVIQEIACAMRLSVRVQGHILSWLDFTDAIDIYLHNFDRVRQLIKLSSLPLEVRQFPNAHERSRVAALLDLSRNCFRKGPDSQLKTRLMSLEDLVIAAAPFNVSEIRDAIYALLYLASDRQLIMSSLGDRSVGSRSLSSDYSRHAVDIYSDFVLYCIHRSQSLDIICRPWATWPHKRGRSHDTRKLPSWISVASFGHKKAWSRITHGQVLLGTSDRTLYNASRGAAIQPTFATTSHSRVLLHVKGIIIGTVGRVNTLGSHGLIRSNSLRLLGWTGNLNNGVDDSLWKTLVANRTPGGTRAPAWYRRACALALSKLDGDGDMDVAAICAQEGQASTMIEYLQRVRIVTKDRKVFQCTAELPAKGATVVGLGPSDIALGDLVCILYGCSVPVVFRRREIKLGKTRPVRLMGMCYVHDNMDGEIFASMTQDEIKERTIKFQIY